MISITRSSSPRVQMSTFSASSGNPTTILPGLADIVIEPAPRVRGAVCLGDEKDLPDLHDPGEAKRKLGRESLAARGTAHGHEITAQDQLLHAGSAARSADSGISASKEFSQKQAMCRVWYVMPTVP